MSSTFICKHCGNNSYEQFTQTQVRCLNCGTVADFNTGYRVLPEFEKHTKTNSMETIALQPTYVSAPLAKRAVNYFIDIIVSSFIILFISIYFELEITTQKGEMTKEGMIIMFITISLYYFIFEFLFGKTIGKIITRTKVISTDGNRATILQCAIRAASRLLPLEQFSGLLMNGVFWHDSIPKTLVVED